LTLSPDGKALAGQGRDGIIHLWDVATGELLRRINTDRAGSLTFSPDSKTLAATEGSSIHLWDAVAGTERLDWPGHRREIRAVAFAPDGKSLVSGGDEGAVVVWRSLDGAKPELLANDMGSIYNVAFAPGRPLFAASGRKGVSLWDANSGKLIRKRAEESRTGMAQFFPDGKTLLVGGDWRLAWLWTIDTDRVLRYNERPARF